MFGRKWQRAEATIVESRAESAGGAGNLGRHEYVVDVRKLTGEVFRATIRHPGGITPPAVGAVVGVEFEARTGNVRFSADDQRISLRTIGNAIQAAEQMRFQVAVEGGVAREVMVSGTTPAEPAGSGPGAMTGSSDVSGSAPGPMQQALLAAFQNQASHRQVAARPQAVPGPQVAQPAHPSTFDPIGPVSTPSTFDAISPINTYSSQVGPPNPFSPPGVASSGSSFSAAGRGDQAQRIASLQALRDQGLLSQLAFESQRQRILDEI